jgi:hypothetical protein
MPLSLTSVVRIRTSNLALSWPRVKLRWLPFGESVTIRAGPLALVDAGRTHASTVNLPDTRMASEIRVAGRSERIRVLPRSSSPPGSHRTALVSAIRRSTAGPLPDTSLTRSPREWKS